MNPLAPTAALHYKAVSVWSLVTSAREFQLCWQPIYSQAKLAFALLELRLRNATLAFEPGNAAYTLMTLPPKLRLHILKLLEEQLKVEFKWQGDDYDERVEEDPFSEETEIDRPNFNADRHAPIWFELFCEIFEIAGVDYMEKRMLQEREGGCPHNFPLEYGVDHRFYVDWQPLPEPKCPFGLCDARDQWEEVERYFSSELGAKDEKASWFQLFEFTDRVQLVREFLEYFGLALRSPWKPFFIHLEPWYNPLQIQVSSPHLPARHVS